MNAFPKSLACCAAALMLTAGCKKTADNTVNYKSAIDNFYATRQSCIWTEPQRFPIQVGKDSDKRAGLDALFNQGLLTRTAGEKTKLLVLTKDVTNYDLTENGRSAFTAATGDPSSGNFCYGHRTVKSIDSSTPNSGEVGANTTVNYHYDFSSAPGWAKTAEVQTAYPRVQANLAGGVATATLADTSNGWIVQSQSATSNVE